MEELEIGDIILLKPDPRDTYGNEIVELTHSKYCHAVMVYSKDSLNHYQFIELVGNGVHIEDITIEECEEDQHTAIVMRPTIELPFQPLKDAADRWHAANVKFDYDGLLLLKRLILTLQDQQTSHYPNIKHNDLLLHFAELANLTRKLNDANQPEAQKPCEFMHCGQFIYQLFHDCGSDYRIAINGGCILSDPGIYNENTLNSLKRTNCSDNGEKLDKVQEITKHLQDLFDLFYKVQIKSPIINERKYRELVSEYYTILSSSTIPIGSIFVTPGDFQTNTDNLYQLESFYSATITRSSGAIGILPNR